jgi:hypothetical protein
MKKKTTRKAPSKRAETKAPRAARATAKRAGPAGPAAQRARRERPVRDTRKARLQRLLFDSVAHMDEEGLVFLLRQAHILSSNANTERINREIASFEHDRGPAPQPEPAVEGKASIEMAPDGKSYFLAIGGARKALTREELGGIVRVCLGAVDRDTGVRNLFRALGRERGDILVDAKIPGPQSPHLRALYDIVLDMARKS